ncbi:hypothetical protein, partial [Catenulispora subtropica]|uniref:glycan biosynthesis hexose transferase WsfD n=1 Tax=Catenulispora subtropica TaxID=450798 RepID=UPI0031D3AAEA
MSTASQETAGTATTAVAPAGPSGRTGRIRTLLSRGFVEPVSVAFGAAVLLFARLMFPAPVGVADNYDGSRLLCHLSLKSVANTDSMRMWVTWQYIHKSGYNCATDNYFGVDLPHPAYSSSQLLLLNVGNQLTRWLGLKNQFGDTALDLRVMAAVACVLIGIAIGLLFAVLRTRRLFRYLLCGALLVVVADASFIDFAASPLSEISAVIGLLFLLPALLLLFREGRSRWAGLALALGAGLFLTTSKAQMLVLIAPLALLMLAFPIRVAFLRGRIGARVIPVGALVVLLAGSYAFTPRQDPHFTLQTKADFLFNELLYVSPDPAADMKALGVPFYYQAQVGRTAWCQPFYISVQSTGQYDSKPDSVKYVARDKAAEPALEKAMSTGNTSKFLLTHPDRAIRVANDAANAFFYVRPTYTGSCWVTHDNQAIPLGNYAQVDQKAVQAGKIQNNPNQVDKRFTPVTSTLGLFRDTGLIPLLLLWLLPAAVAVRLLARRRERAAGERKALAWTTLFLTSVAILQFGAGAYFDGIDTSKHLNLSIFASVVAVVTAVATARLRPEPAAAADAGAVPDQTRKSEADVTSASTDKNLSVLVIIPTYNESENLEKI